MRLLAKSTKTPENPESGRSLEDHIFRVHENISLIAIPVLENIKMLRNISVENERFKFICELAALFHDLGKANDHFQKMIRKKLEIQGLRHENVSLFLLARYWDHFKFESQWEAVALFTAVAGHHFKFPEEGDRPGLNLTVYESNIDYQTIISRINQTCGLDIPLFNKDWTISLKPRDIESLKNDAFSKIVKAIRCVEKDDNYKLIVSSVKSLLHSADIAGSILTDRDIKIWLQSSLGIHLTEDSLSKIASEKLNGNNPREFQQNVRNSTSKTTLVRAGCGSGKTVAAYMWAAKNIASHRLFFCYPTTGTASDGFSTYMIDPDFEAQLVHHRAEIDYELLPNMPPIQNGYDENSDDEYFAKIDAFKLWPIPAVVCTAHTVLGLLVNSRRAVYAWPSISNSIFIFDEIHAYSPKLFSYLLEFLKIFKDVPVLLMTATLPEDRKIAIETVRKDLKIIDGPPAREKAKRYKILDFTDKDTDSIWPEICESYKNGKKILYICNTVSKAMEVFEKAEELGLNPEIYHSRFKYCDRIKRHMNTINKFRSFSGPVFAVTTQVAEMSLDLSADFLISELAPVPALIQRLGRLNRYAEIPEFCLVAYIIKNSKSLPYSKHDNDPIWETSRKWLTFVSESGSVSQSELSEASIRFDENTGVEYKPAIGSWFNGIWKTRIEQSLEEHSPSIEIILENDSGKNDLQKYVIPMPIPSQVDISLWKRVRHYPVCPSDLIIYSERTGAKWPQKQ